MVSAVIKRYTIKRLKRVSFKPRLHNPDFFEKVCLLLIERIIQPDPAPPPNPLSEKLAWKLIICQVAAPRQVISSPAALCHRVLFRNMLRIRITRWQHLH